MTFSFKRSSVGCYDSLPRPLQTIIQEIVAGYHYRNGKKYNDGSMGEIRITVREFNDLLALIFTLGKQEEVIDNEIIQ